MNMFATIDGLRYFRRLALGLHVSITPLSLLFARTVLIMYHVLKVVVNMSVLHIKDFKLDTTDTP